jgi:hypothetical protein
MRDKTREKGGSCATHRVFPSAHSTQPSSGPNVSTGIRSSNGKRPSSLKDCFSEVDRNSFSGIEGDGGLMVVRCVVSLTYLAIANISLQSRPPSLSAMVRLITHNLLACHVKGCTSNNFPLEFKDVQIELREAEYNPDFLRGFMPKLEWKALFDAAKQVFLILLLRRLTYIVSWAIARYHWSGRRC